MLQGLHAVGHALFTEASQSYSSTGQDHYNWKLIGNQIWMTENLNVDKFRNGDPILHAKTDAEWKKAGKNKQPAWCYYDNNPANGEKYGKLYNWYAVNDPRGLAPKGWHVPSEAEWATLTDFLGEWWDGGLTKMKSTSGWAENDNGSNESGFTALPAGLRDGSGEFREDFDWWSSSEGGRFGPWYRFLRFGIGFIVSYHKGYGLSVRCLKDG
jgi:uncharacterized protein (TIGR02145 family)